LFVSAFLVNVNYAASQTYTYSDLVERLSCLQHLATPPAVGEKGGSFSSWHRQARYDQASGKYVKWWANDDGGGFMDSEGTMAKIEGPGIIWRIWSAAPGGGNIEFYIDGAEKPTLAMPFINMFDNKKPPFDYPEMVGMLAKGQNFYIPIPFQKSIRIRGAKDWGRYYQISYTRFPAGTKVPSFTGKFSDADRAALKKANDIWGKRGPKTHVSDKDNIKQVTIRLEPGQEKVLASYDRPAAITSFTMDRPELTWEESLDVLRELTINITWDKDKTPAVWSPIGDFFGTGAGENLFRSLTMGMTEDKYYSNWYMPFSKAKIVLRNDGDRPRELTFTIHTAKVTGNVNDLLRFHCKWHRDDYSGLNKKRFSEDRWPDWPVLKTSKTAGRFCGFQLHIWNPLHLWNEELKRKYQGGIPEGDLFAPGTQVRALFDNQISQHYWWGEGDEKFFVDGEKMPSTFGTGSEDYFGYAWGTAEKFDSGAQCQTRNHGNVGHIAVLRNQIADNVPFQKSFEATIEKYHGNNWPLLYATTARWYQEPATEGPYQAVPLKQRVKYYVRPELKPYWKREFTVSKKYLVLPMRDINRSCVVEMTVAGKKVRVYECDVAPDSYSVKFYAYFTIDAYKGKPAAISVRGVAKEGFDLIRESNHIPGEETFYTDQDRPQFHFSQKVGWNNDTNGMVYYDGQWHLYFQHNPVSRGAHNMTWGHAVSGDLVHWEQQGNAIFPKTMAREWCFSGSAVVDKTNSAGFQTGKEKTLVAVFTDTGCGECLAYSNDRGLTFTYYQNNPVVKHNGRDPKVIWYAPGGHWVMAVHDEEEGVHGIAFYSSTNLKDWRRQSKLPGYHECPELFELPVDGNPSTPSSLRAGKDHTRWVVFGGDAKYAIGAFDGKKFTPEHEGKHTLHYGQYYASQTFSNPPDGRRIQVGWAQTCAGRTFSQTFSFPHRLTLRTTKDGVRMFAEPVREIEKLYKKKYTAKSQELTERAPVKLGVSGELFDVRATFDVDDAKTFGLDIGGNRVIYDVGAGKFSGFSMENDVSMTPVNGKISIRVLVDRPMLEIIGNDGRVYITTTRPARGDVNTVKAFADGGKAKLLGLEVNELKSIWKKQ